MSEYVEVKLEAKASEQLIKEVQESISKGCEETDEERDEAIKANIKCCGGRCKSK